MNYWDLLIIVIIACITVISIITVRRNRGKCSSCGFGENCPFRKN